MIDFQNLRGNFDLVCDPRQANGQRYAYNTFEDLYISFLESPNLENIVKLYNISSSQAASGKPHRNHQ